MEHDLQQEQRRAFEAEVLPHVDEAYRVALALTRRHADAEDLVQDACLRAYRGFGGFRLGSNARAWLMTIVRRQFLNDRRRADARPRFVFYTGDDGERALPEPVDTKTPGPEEEALLRLERERVLQALAGVPEPYRTVVKLVDLGELRYAEAAKRLGCPVGTVMSRLHRGRLMLAARLGAGDEMSAATRPPETRQRHADD